jgi:hypothetical protein
MKIEIKPTTTLQEIKKVFNTSYPGLKIDFFIDKNEDGNYTADEKVHNYNAAIADIGATKTTGEITFEANNTVAQIEDTFKNDFGIIAQIFRKSGSSWLMTSSSDNQSLASLNDTALTSSEASNNLEIPNASDRQELE